MELSAQTVGVLLILAIVLALLAIGAAAAALSGQRKVRRAYQRFTMGREDDVLTMLERHIDEVQALRSDAGDIRERTDELRELLRGTMSKVATVRYDAFDDMGGRLSFSTAFLDERGDGVVMTSINGRLETRTYAKRVTGGTSSHNLSEEEQEAIDLALSGEGRTETLSAVRRVSRGSRVGRARDAS